MTTFGASFTSCASSNEITYINQLMTWKTMVIGAGTSVSGIQFGQLRIGWHSDGVEKMVVIQQES
jgi:hypothetical protein